MDNKNQPTVPFVPWNQIDGWRKDWSGRVDWFFITHYRHPLSGKNVEVIGSRMDEGKVILYSRKGREVYLHLSTQLHYGAGGSQYISLPGGGINKGESPILCVNREVLEELGAVIKPESVFKVWSGYRYPYLYDTVQVFAAEVVRVDERQGGDEEDFEESNLLSIPIPLSGLETFMANAPQLFCDAVTVAGLLMFKQIITTNQPI